MLKIRLKRQGRKKQAAYRIIIIDSKKRRDGRAIQEIGFYNPLTKETKLNLEIIEKRMSQGAQPTKIISRLVKNIKYK